MERSRLALLVIATGVVMVLLALLADVLGIGAEGFGWRRGAFLAVGIFVVLAGVAYLMAPARRDGTAPTPHATDNDRS